MRQSEGATSGLSSRHREEHVAEELPNEDQWKVLWERAEQNIRRVHRSSKVYALVFARGYNRYINAVVVQLLHLLKDGCLICEIAAKDYDQTLRCIVLYQVAWD